MRRANWKLVYICYNRGVEGGGKQMSELWDEPWHWEEVECCGEKGKLSATTLPSFLSSHSCLASCQNTNYRNSGNAQSISNAKCFFIKATLDGLLIPYGYGEYGTTVKASGIFLNEEKRAGKLSENQQDVQNIILQCKLFIDGPVQARKIQGLLYKLY